jgi:hypothetical protein
LRDRPKKSNGRHLPSLLADCDARQGGDCDADKFDELAPSHSDTSVGRSSFDQT